jgi:hypothetical protein
MSTSESIDQKNNETVIGNDGVTFINNQNEITVVNESVRRITGFNKMRHLRGFSLPPMKTINIFLMLSKMKLSTQIYPWT